MKRNLIEEINRIKVIGDMLNEAINPTSIISSLFAKITKTALDNTALSAFKVLEKKGVITIDKATKTLTQIDWAKLTDDELKLLFSAKPLRDVLEDVTTKAGINLTSAAQRKAFKGDFKRIVKGYDDAKGITLPEPQTIGQSFVQGYKTTMGSTLFLKAISKRLPIIKTFVPSSWKAEMTIEEYKKIGNWFFLGVGDFNAIKQIFKKYGFKNAIANLSGQVFQKWVFWSAVFTVCNFLMSGFDEKSRKEQIYKNDIEAALDRIKNSLEVSSLNWVFPVKKVWDKIISPWLLGGWQPKTMGEFYDRVKKLMNTSEEKMREIEDSNSSESGLFNNDSSTPSSNQNDPAGILDNNK